MSRGPSGVVTRSLMRAPIAERFERRPESRSVIQRFPWPGFLNRTEGAMSLSNQPPISSRMSWSPSLSASPNETPCPFWRLPTSAETVTSWNTFPPGVAEQSVRDQCAERRLAVAEIDVGPAVVVEVTEVRAHRQCHAVEPDGVRHVAERPVVVVAVQSGHLASRLHPPVHRGETAHVGGPVSGDVQ